MIESCLELFYQLRKDLEPFQPSYQKLNLYEDTLWDGIDQWWSNIPGNADQARERIEELKKVIKDLILWRDKICLDSSGRAHWKEAKKVIQDKTEDGSVLRHYLELEEKE